MAASDLECFRTISSCKGHTLSALEPRASAIFIACKIEGATRRQALDDKEYLLCSSSPNSRYLESQLVDSRVGKVVLHVLLSPVQQATPNLSKQSSCRLIHCLGIVSILSLCDYGMEPPLAVQPCTSFQSYPSKCCQAFFVGIVIPLVDK